MKLLVNRLLFQLGVGIFFGSALATADIFGAFLLLSGMIIGAMLYAK